MNDSHLMSEQPLLRNPLLERLAGGDLALAMIVKQCRTADIAVAAHSCGYDAIYVDLEHSVIPEEAAAQICITAYALGITPVVRVPSLDPHYAARLLDAGAMGIVFPHIDNADEATRAVKACRFAPEGERSVAGAWPQLGYRGWPADQVRQAFNRSVTVICMLETPEAVANAESIAAVPGVDILHIGSNDLCDALGIPGQFEHIQIDAAYQSVVAACRQYGKFAGAGGLGGNPAVAQKAIARGVRFITAGNDWAFMLGAARQRATMLREAFQA